MALWRAVNSLVSLADRTMIGGAPAASSRSLESLERLWRSAAPDVRSAHRDSYVRHQGELRCHAWATG